MKILSLFDGMSCGAIAFRQLGITVDEYHAFEIDKFAVKVSQHNFPEIIHHGDVFSGDFTKFKNFDWLIGGSPCTYWSIAQNPKNRETTSKGLGWELFQQYIRALHEAEPEYFLYENNDSMDNAIRESISEAFGFDPVMINSALVSAQFRKRLYWVGKKNPDGTYSKSKIELHADRRILVRDILDDYPCFTTVSGKALALTVKRIQHGQGFGPVKYSDEHTPATNCAVRIGNLPNDDGTVSSSQGVRIYDVNGKSVTLNANGGEKGAKTGLYAVKTDKSNKKYRVYEVRNNQIQQDGKNYPLKVPDGFYIIRKLTVSECMKLQTVPDWYDFSVISQTRAYKCLGNGWTIEVIMHLIKQAIKGKTEDFGRQLKFNIYF